MDAANSGAEVIHLPEHVPEILAGICRGLQCRNAFRVLTVARHAEDKKLLTLHRVACRVRNCAGADYENQKYSSTDKIAHLRPRQTVAFDSEISAYTLPKSMPGCKYARGA